MRRRTVWLFALLSLAACEAGAGVDWRRDLALAGKLVLAGEQCASGIAHAIDAGDSAGGSADDASAP